MKTTKTQQYFANPIQQESNNFKKKLVKISTPKKSLIRLKQIASLHHSKFKKFGYRSGNILNRINTKSTLLTLDQLKILHQSPKRQNLEKREKKIFKVKVKKIVSSRKEKKISSQKFQRDFFSKKNSEAKIDQNQFNLVKGLSEGQKKPFRINMRQERRTLSTPGWTIFTKPTKFDLIKYCKELKSKEKFLNQKKEKIVLKKKRRKITIRRSQSCRLEYSSDQKHLSEKLFKIQSKTSLKIKRKFSAQNPQKSPKFKSIQEIKQKDTKKQEFAKIQKCNFLQKSQSLSTQETNPDEETPSLGSFSISSSSRISIEKQFVNSLNLCFTPSFSEL